MSRRECNRDAEENLPTMSIEQLYFGEDMNTCSFSKAHMNVYNLNKSEETVPISKRPSYTELHSANSLHSIVNCPSETLNNPNKAVFVMEETTTKILLVNNVAMNIFGYSLEEFMSMTLLDIFYNTTQVAKFARKVSLHTGRQGFSMKSSIIFDGKVMRFKSKNQESVPVSFWLKTLEVSNRMMAVMELVDMSEGKIYIDKSGIIRKVDLAITKHIFKCDEKDLEGKTIYNLVPQFRFDQSELQDSPESRVNVLKKQHCTGHSQNVKQTIPLTLHLLESADSELLTVDTKLFNCPSGLIIVNEAGVIETCNQNFTRTLFGYSKDQLRKMPIIELIPNFYEKTSPIATTTQASLSTMGFDCGLTEEIGDDGILLSALDNDSKCGTSLNTRPVSSVTSLNSHPEEDSLFFSALDNDSNSVSSLDTRPISSATSLSSRLEDDSILLSALDYEFNSLTGMETLPVSSVTSLNSCDAIAQDDDMVSTVFSSYVLHLESSLNGSSGMSSPDATPTGSVIGDLFETAESSYNPADSDDDDIVIGSSPMISDILTISNGFDSSSSSIEEFPDAIVPERSESVLADDDLEDSLINAQHSPVSSESLSSSHSSSDSNYKIKPGFYNGIGLHRDGGTLEIDYRVTKIQLTCPVEPYYLVWISLLPLESILSVYTMSEMNTFFNKVTDAQLTSGPYGEAFTNGEEIGKGSFGLVKWAYSKVDQHMVATKFIKRTQIHNNWKMENSVYGIVPREVQIMLMLDHPNVVRVEDFFTNDLFYIVVMHTPTKCLDLYEFILQDITDEGLNSLIFRQVVNAVLYLHSKNIVHRDLKDENTIIDTNYNVKLIDFGSAAFMKKGKPFKGVFGTFEYSSPEVIKGDPYAGPELEVWTLGCMLFLLSTAENPFHRIEDLVKARFNIGIKLSDDLVQLLDGMLEYSVAKRFTMEDIAKHPWLHQLVNITDYKTLDEQGVFLGPVGSTSARNVATLSSGMSEENMPSMSASTDELEVAVKTSQQSFSVGDAVQQDACSTAVLTASVIGPSAEHNQDLLNKRRSTDEVCDLLTIDLIHSDNEEVEGYDALTQSLTDATTKVFD